MTGTEGDHHPVAEKLIDLAAETVDDLDEPIEYPVELPREVALRDQTLGSLRESPQIQKHHGGVDRVAADLHRLGVTVEANGPELLVDLCFAGDGRKQSNMVSHVGDDLEPLNGMS